MSISHVFEWLSNHHKPLRVYEWNEKHGENGKGAHLENKGEEVSVLESSREHAGELLPKAIGLPYYDTLYCYDAIFNKSIVLASICSVPCAATEELISERMTEPVSILPTQS